MRKFVFNLAALLNLREWEEQGARQNYLAAARKARQMELAARDAGKKRDAIIESWNTTSSEAFSRNDRLALEGSIWEAGRQEEEFMARLDRAKDEEKRARAEVSKAIRKRKAVQQLKERRLEAYKIEAAKAEISEIEDIYNARANERNKL